MVRCPRGTSSQVKANLGHRRRPSWFSLESSMFSWVYDPLKGQMVWTGEREDGLVAESEDSEVDSGKADKRCPPSARDELVYFFVSCFLDILVKRWEGKTCMKPKLGGYQSLVGNYSEEFGEDLGPCEISMESSTADFLKDLYQKRMSNLSKEKLKRDSESSEYEYPNEDDLESAGAPEQWKASVADEDVEFVLENGVWYRGRVSRRLMEGEGTYFWADGAAYQGEFEGGCVTGKGRLEFSDLSVYEGDVYKAFRHGEGMHCFADSQVMYSGQWWLGKKHGYGLMVYNDPSEGHNYYKGEWQDGVKEGFGLRQYPSGAKYIGFWSKGHRNGKGVMIWSNNDIYRGQWENGLMHGYGEYTWSGFINRSLSYPANNTYRGNWSQGKRNGKGVLELKNGSVIETTWTDNAKNGMGVIVCTNGIVVAATPLFLKDKQSSFSKPEDKIGVLLKDQVRTHKRNEDQILTYASNIIKSTASIIPIHSPIHTLDLSTHSNKLFHQKKAFIINESFSTANTYILTVTPDTNTSDRPLPRTHSSASIDLTDLQHTRLSESILHEEKQLRNYIVLKVSALRACYDHYATLACDDPTSSSCVLLRIFLWQMLIDAGIPSSALSLVHIDLLLAQEEPVFLDSPHDPFERIQFWQFLQVLVILSWHFYGRFIYGEPPIVEDKRLSDFFEYRRKCECKTVLKAAFEYFVEFDVFCGRFRDGMWYPSEEKRFEESELAPMEAMYELYCGVGEPHSARDLLGAICVGRPEVDEESSVVRYFEKLPSYNVQGRNALIVAGELRHIPAPEPFNSPEIFDFERRQVEASPKAELRRFRTLGPRRLIRCLIEVCPGILGDEFIANMDYPLTFLEFYKTIIQCTELQLRIKAMNEIRGNVIAEYKTQMEEYRKQLSEYEKQKETSVVSRKKSRQFSDVSKKGRK